MSMVLSPPSSRRTRWGGKSDPGQVAKKDCRALAKAIGIGAFVEDTVRELAEVLPERPLTVAAELRDEYGRLPVTDLVAGVIRKPARRSLRVLKP
jgi:hypothetical protein